MGAHPHVCGEHKVAFANNEQVQGSSPRMRGTHVLSRAADDLHGLIPTYAGNTGHYTVRGGVHGAHPHVCGEHTGEVRLSFAHLGSSPRMRGTPRIRHATDGFAGLIPTYAGNTHYSTETPDTRGGSSPRMRGTHVCVNLTLELHGLIPTYAGNTHSPAPDGGLEGAHPHVCGEHCDPIGPAPSPEGSSPRMRGTPANGCGVVGFSGLIPTYAGNTKIFDTKPGGARAHPHVCGEHCSNRETPEASPGSSPRMRGTQP